VIGTTPEIWITLPQNWQRETRLLPSRSSAAPQAGQFNVLTGLFMEPQFVSPAIIAHKYSLRNKHPRPISPTEEASIFLSFPFHPTGQFPAFTK
jgi:hypothetical protein